MSDAIMSGMAIKNELREIARAIEKLAEAHASVAEAMWARLGRKIEQEPEEGA